MSTAARRFGWWIPGGHHPAGSTLSLRAGVKLNRTNFSVGGAGGGRRRIDIGVVDNLRLSSVRVRSAVIAISDISSNNAAIQEQGKPPIDGYLARISCVRSAP